MAIESFLLEYRVRILATVTVLLVAIAVLRGVLRSFRIRRQFPGPPVNSFWKGNLDETLADDVHEKWRLWHRVHGPVFQTMNGPFSRTIYIGNPKIIARILNANWPKAAVQYEGFKPLSGNALFTQMDHQRWHKQRKSLSPAFGPGVVNTQLSSLQRYLPQYVNLLDQAASQNTIVDFSLLNTLLTLDFIGEVAFGIDLHALEQGNSCRIMKIFEIVLPELMKCGLFPLRAKIPVCKSTREMHRAISELRGMAAHAVESSRSKDDSLLPQSKSEKRIFEILARKKDSRGSYVFSSEELVDNYVTFLVAGGDPTAHTITFAIYEIIRHPEVLKELRVELDRATSLDEKISSTTQVKSPYLNAIIKETMRMHGPGFGTFRYCEEDTEIDGIKLPANTTLALWNPQVHRDPNTWGPDADVFRPERWTNNAEPPQPGAYFPFSYGPRNCLGQGLAMLEMSLTLATLFRQFDLAFEDGFEMEFLPSFTMCAKNGLRVQVSRRSRTVSSPKLS
ncbi:cytochrome P450 46A1 [Venturia nashicola]|nr:cytochrome P450 46A1 [Venturia nashicola]